MATATKEPDEKAGPRRIGKFAWTTIAAAVAVTSSLVALAFELNPSWRPDPGTNLGASISVFAVEPHITYDQFLSRLALNDTQIRTAEHRYCHGRPDCPKLHYHGELVYAQTDVEGFKRRSVTMRAAVYRGVSRTRVDNTQQTVATEKLQAPSDRAVVPFWLPCPNYPTRPFFVRVELFHKGDHSLLAVADSAVFKAHCQIAQ